MGIQIGNFMDTTGIIPVVFLYLCFYIKNDL